MGVAGGIAAWVADARSLGSIGAALTAAVVFALRADVIAVFVRVRIFSPNTDYSLEASTRSSGRTKAVILIPMPSEYVLPQALARYVRRQRFAPEELRKACRMAGEGLGHADACEARFRSAAEMVALWKGLNLPAWVAPYALRDARIGYLNGYEEELLYGELPEMRVQEAAKARWGDSWRRKLKAAHQRQKLEDVEN